MALFTKKIWKNRLSEYPNRRKLTKENGTTELVTVARSEGTVSQEGDAFSADNMNNLEERISKAIGTGSIPAGLGADIISALNALNTGIPALTFDNTWQICYKVTGWGLFVLIPLISTAQKLTVTKAEMFIRLSGTWESLTITRTRAFGPYHQIIFEDRNGLTDGIYLCRITGKLEK